MIMTKTMKSFAWSPCLQTLLACLWMSGFSAMIASYGLTNHVYIQILCGYQIIFAKSVILNIHADFLD